MAINLDDLETRAIKAGFELLYDKAVKRCVIGPSGVLAEPPES